MGNDHPRQQYITADQEEDSGQKCNPPNEHAFAKKFKCD